MDSMDIHGCHGYPWIQWMSRDSMDIHGFNGYPSMPWISMDPMFLGSHGYPWISMDSVDGIHHNSIAPPLSHTYHFMMIGFIVAGANTAWAILLGPTVAVSM